jgi:hypothetical protein
VTPGDAATFQVTVGNTGPIVDELSLQVVGEPANWTTLDPPVQHLLPGARGTTTVHLQPPRRPTSTAGPTTIGLKVSSREDPTNPLIREGVVDVAPFENTVVSLQSPVARARTTASYLLRLSNQGNHAVAASAGAADPEGTLSFTVSPAEVAMQSGEDVTVTIRAHTGLLVIGRTRRVPFRITVLSDGPEPTTHEATFVQRPLLPWWLLPLAAIVGVALLSWLASLDPAAIAVLAAIAAAIVGVVRAVKKRRTPQIPGVTPPPGPTDTPPAPPPPPPPN